MIKPLIPCMFVDDAYHSLENTTPISNKPIPPPKQRDVHKTKPPAAPPKPPRELALFDTDLKQRKLPLLPGREVHSLERALEMSSDGASGKQAGVRTVSSPADVRAWKKTPSTENQVPDIVVKQQWGEAGQLAQSDTGISTKSEASYSQRVSGRMKTQNVLMMESQEVSMDELYTMPTVLQLEIPMSSNVAYNGSATLHSQPSYPKDKLPMSTNSAEPSGAEIPPQHSYDEPHTFW